MNHFQVVCMYITFSGKVALSRIRSGDHPSRSANVRHGKVIGKPTPFLASEVQVAPSQSAGATSDSRMQSLFARVRERALSA